MGSKIKGLTDLNRKLALLPITQKKLVHKALRKNAEEVTAMQKRLVPVRATGRKRGALKRSIRFKFFDPLKMEMSAGDQRKRGVFYARFVEFGTRPGKRGRKITVSGRKRKQLRTHPGTRAQPFFFPAYRSLRKRVRSRLTRSITKAAREVAAKK